MGNQRAGARAQDPLTGAGPGRALVLTVDDAGPGCQKAVRLVQAYGSDIDTIAVLGQRGRGAHCAVPVQVAFSRPVLVDSGQVQSTWSMLDGIPQARPAGQPVLAAVAAAAVGSQRKVQVW